MELDEALNIARDENDPSGLWQAANVLADAVERVRAYCNGRLYVQPGDPIATEILAAIDG